LLRITRLPLLYTARDTGWDRSFICMALASFAVTVLMLVVNIAFIPVAMSTPPPPDPMHGFLLFVAFCLLVGGLFVNFVAFVLALISAVKTSKRRPFALAALFIAAPQLAVEMFFAIHYLTH
jgi:hypothetical protein